MSLGGGDELKEVPPEGSDAPKEVLSQGSAESNELHPKVSDESKNDAHGPKEVSAAQRCIGLQSDNKKVRKNTLVDLENYLKNPSPTNDELRKFFTETQMYTLNALRDQSELVREQAIKFWTFLLIGTLPINDFYLTYVFPVLVERIGSVEIIEESEEIRLKLLQLLQQIILKYSQKEQLKPFVGDIILILKETVKDKFPAIKESSCEVILDAAKALPRDFHLQAENLIRPVLTCLPHQRYKVRVEAINAIGEIIMHSSYKGVNEVVNPLGEKLFDPIPAVRRAIARVAARWMLEYRDRYSHFQQFLPLILTGLNDEIEETRKEAHEFWEKVGLQYEKENEKDLKDQQDFLLELPKYYPEHLKRPNLGCRVLVQRNVSKIAPALSAELQSWQPEVRVRCSQLLCAIAWHAEQHLTQNLQTLLPGMYSAARDEDQRVTINIKQASEIIGLFVPHKTWFKLILPAIQMGAHWGHLSVLAGLIKGTPQEYICADLLEITTVLIGEDILYTRKKYNQVKLLECFENILEKYNEKTSREVAYDLFKIIIVVHSLRYEESENFIPKLEDLGQTLGGEDLWGCFLDRLLVEVDVDPKSWTTTTDRRCIFETILLEANSAFGKNLEKIGKILSDTLNPEGDAESRLKTFWALSEAFSDKERIFKDAPNLDQFFLKLISDVFIPNLVWHAGRTAEAVRTMSAACLKSALEPSLIDIFKTPENFREIFDKILPLLISLIDDASSRSRRLSVEILTLLKGVADGKQIWDEHYLVKIYPEILKRFDDPVDHVRLCAIESLEQVFLNAPDRFKDVHYKQHHEFLVDTLLIHYDDKEVEENVLLCLKVLASVNKDVVEERIERKLEGLQNQKGCKQVLEYIKTLS